MSLREPSALVAALAVHSQPAASQLARRSNFPAGMTFLLEVAAGDEEALHVANTMTGQTDETLRKAAGFYIEQVMFSQTDDSYRILGADRTASMGELRRHMVLIMKWLHPDVEASSQLQTDVDRTIFVSRVTGAWENLKSSERRALYDSILATRPTEPHYAMRTSPYRSHGADASLTKQRRSNRSGRPGRRFRVKRHDGLLGRIMDFLRGNR